ncbi:MAG: adenylate/guanylate cyclase domain-containing protein, partial [Candidatus Eremiobacteraeota bacterium]|nr:adenylate/guanylate cyclase domain-containing protein [Candidatus Eremiobacteraeota bacterium]
MSRRREVQVGGEKSASLPTGTVTFLFTDIEGSTERWEAHREAMQAALRRHDRLLRTIIERHGGYVFKTVGDAFCAAFGQAPEAALAAVDLQREMAAADFVAVGNLRVRAALHTGQAEERDADYFGPAVNRVARLLAIGHGGQVLISSATAELVRTELPDELALLDLGTHRLRGLSHEERVYQLLAPGLANEFLPLTSLRELPNNLSAQTTTFRGREHDLEQLNGLL